MLCKLLLILPFFATTFLLSGKSFPQSYQTIVLDDYYSQMVAKDAKDKHTHKFQVREAEGIILDCSKYDFSAIRKMNKGKDPDLIHLVCKSGTFTIHLNMQGTIIDKSTVQSVGEKKEFLGFQKGDTPILGIGTIEYVETTARLVTYWVGMIDVN